MSEYRPRSRGGLVTSNYSLPPTFSVGNLPDVPVTPSRFRGQRTGVSPSWEGRGDIMSFPNLNAAANSLMVLGRRSPRGRAKGADDSDGDGDGGATTSTSTPTSSTPIRPGMSTTVPKKRKSNPFMDDPVDSLGDPGAPTAAPGTFLQTDQAAPTRPFTVPAEGVFPKINAPQDNVRGAPIAPWMSGRSSWALAPGSDAGAFDMQAEMDAIDARMRPQPIAAPNTIDKSRGNKQRGLNPGSLQRSLNRYQ